MFVFHRFLRLYPAYIVMVLIYWQLIPFTGSAPMWSAFTDITGSCDDNIWKNLLLVNNFAYSGSTIPCFQWGWVVASEVQFCLVGVILLYVYFYKSQKVGKILIISLFLLSTLASIWIANSNDYNAAYFTANNPSDFYNNFFMRPYIRIATFLLGMLAGLLRRNFKEGRQVLIAHPSPFLTLCIWLIGEPSTMRLSNTIGK